MKQNKEILTENKVQQLLNLKNFAQAQTFKKVLSNIFNVSLDNGDIHYIFERLNIPFSIMNVRGMSVKYYKRDAVIEVFYKGLLRKEVENLVHNRTLTNAQSTIQGPSSRKSVVVNTTNRYIPNNNDSMEDEYEYPNGENDMEKYSEYLINNVYEGRKNMNKIDINENDIKNMVETSIKTILNEAFFNKFKTNPYDHNKKGEGFTTQQLKDEVSLYHIRQRLQEIVRNCNPEDVAIAKKQAMRLYKLVDAMINQGF